jgi:peptide/nickel transport system substrate-binding protein
MSTATLAFISGRLDMTFPYTLTVPLFKDVRSQEPDAICELTPVGGFNSHLIVNRDKPPFDSLELRRAMALSLDRKAFIDIISQGEGDIGGALQPAPAGLWGMPPDLLKELPGYDPDVQKNRAQAREIMEKLGYRPDNRLKIKVSTRDLPSFRDPAVILHAGSGPRRAGASTPPRGKGSGIAPIARIRNGTVAAFATAIMSKRAPRAEANPWRRAAQQSAP